MGPTALTDETPVFGPRPKVGNKLRGPDTKPVVRPRSSDTPHNKTTGPVHIVPGTALKDVLRVQKGNEAFASAAISIVSRPRGSLFAPIEGYTLSKKAYSTLQISRNHHVELNSDLLYCNHSCTPSLEFDVSEMIVRVARDRDLEVGDPLTFWYPSTEWSMAQKFKCTCGAKDCHGWVGGAAEMNQEVMQKYWLNDHIVALLAEQAPWLKGDADSGN